MILLIEISKFSNFIDTKQSLVTLLDEFAKLSDVLGHRLSNSNNTLAKKQSPNKYFCFLSAINFLTCFLHLCNFSGKEKVTDLILH